MTGNFANTVWAHWPGPNSLGCRSIPPPFCNSVRACGPAISMIARLADRSTTAACRPATARRKRPIRSGARPRGGRDQPFVRAEPERAQRAHIGDPVRHQRQRHPGEIGRNGRLQPQPDLLGETQLRQADRAVRQRPGQHPVQQRVPQRRAGLSHAAFPARRSGSDPGATGARKTIRLPARVHRIRANSG